MDESVEPKAMEKAESSSTSSHRDEGASFDVGKTPASTGNTLLMDSVESSTSNFVENRSSPLEQTSGAPSGTLDSHTSTYRDQVKLSPSYAENNNSLESLLKSIDICREYSNSELPSTSNFIETHSFPFKQTSNTRLGTFDSLTSTYQDKIEPSPSDAENDDSSRTLLNLESLLKNCNISNPGKPLPDETSTSFQDVNYPSLSLLKTAILEAKKQETITSQKYPVSKWVPRTTHAGNTIGTAPFSTSTTQSNFMSCRPPPSLPYDVNRPMENQQSYQGIIDWNPGPQMQQGYQRMLEPGMHDTILSQQSLHPVFASGNIASESCPATNTRNAKIGIGNAPLPTSTIQPYIRPYLASYQEQPSQNTRTPYKSSNQARPSAKSGNSSTYRSQNFTRWQQNKRNISEIPMLPPRKFKYIRTPDTAEQCSTNVSASQIAAFTGQRITVNTIEEERRQNESGGNQASVSEHSSTINPLGSYAEVKCDTPMCDNKFIVTKPFKCELCPDRTFWNEPFLRKHYRDEHNSAPVFICKSCWERICY